MMRMKIIIIQYTEVMESSNKSLSLYLDFIIQNTDDAANLQQTLILVQVCKKIRLV